METGKGPSLSKIISVYDEAMKRDQQQIERMQLTIESLEERIEKLKKIIFILVEEDNDDAESVCSNSDTLK